MQILEHTELKMENNQHSMCSDFNINIKQFFSFGPTPIVCSDGMSFNNMLNV